MRKLLAVILLLASLGLADTQYLVPGSYATITLAEAARPASVTGGGIQDIIVSDGTYSEAVAISGSTGQSASDYTRLRPASDTLGGVIITQGTSGTWTLLLSEPYSQAKKLKLIHSYAGATAATAGGYAAVTNFTLGEDILIEISGNAYGMGLGSSAQNNTLRKIVAYNTSSLSTIEGAFGSSGGVNGNQFQNCGTKGFHWCFRTALVAKNCWGDRRYATGTAAPACFSGLNAGSTNNASDDSTATVGTGNLNLVSNFGLQADNYHIEPTSVLAGAGTNLSGTFTTDIDGQTITTWMIGADFPYVGPATGGTVRRCGPRSRILGGCR